MLYRNWRTRKGSKWKQDEFWTHEPVDTCDDNPPIKSMKLINRQFSKMVKKERTLRACPGQSRGTGDKV